VCALLMLGPTKEVVLKKRLPLIAGVVIAGLLFGGCFTLRGFRWSVHKIKRGEKGGLILLMKPATTEKEKNYPLFLIGLADPTPPNPGDPDPPRTMQLVKPRTFDTKGKFGGPHKLVMDNALRDELLDSGFCDATSSDSVDWFLLRTEKAIGNRGAITKTAETKISLKATQQATGVEFVQVETGGWVDLDDDGVYTPGEKGKDLAGCIHSFTTDIPTGPPDEEEETKSQIMEFFR
jgi:hypothetical protein